MSKRYRGYRRLTRTYPKQKWQMSVVNVPDLMIASTLMNNNQFNAVHVNICQTVVPTDASAASVVSANNIVKVGNFKFKGSFTSSVNAAGFSIIVYMIFVPQGIEPNNTLVSTDNLATSIFYSHPEWVLAWTQKNLDEQGSNDISISSRLKRNLNSGDRIMLGVLAINKTGAQSTVNFKLYGTVAYYARAN